MEEKDEVDDPDLVKSQCGKFSETGMAANFLSRTTSYCTYISTETDIWCSTSFKRIAASA
jgi:hypothetical protein